MKKVCVRCGVELSMRGKLYCSLDCRRSDNRDRLSTPLTEWEWAIYRRNLVNCESRSKLAKEFGIGPKQMLDLIKRGFTQATPAMIKQMYDRKD